MASMRRARHHADVESWDRSVLGKLLQRRGPRPPPSTHGALVYAVGDIHGRADLLEPLLASVQADALQAGAAPTIVFVGDYVDRGAGSRQVVDLVCALQDAGEATVHALRGNHDDCLVRFLHEPEFGPNWAKIGGTATLASYGVDPPAAMAPVEAWTEASAALNAALPQRHHTFFKGLQLHVRQGDYLFVHAGVRKGVGIEKQTPEDLMWIRDEFLDAEWPSEQVVVHGHTPADEAFVGEHRIGIDTGAYATGVLSAIKLQGTARALLRVAIKRAG
jgi:serine/threonine protein phosphatase 1